jgi:hypothetical protein
MNARLKIFTLVIVLVMALASFGWVANIAAIHTQAVTQMTTGAALAYTGADANIADVLPFRPAPVPCVSWNG